MTVEYLDLTDYLAIAEAVTGLDVSTLSRIADLTLADSALHAPSAGFGNDDLYPDFVDTPAVLIVRLAKNHARPDGNKRTAWVALRMFIEINGWQWRDYPSVDDAEAAVLVITAGEWVEVNAADWLSSAHSGGLGVAVAARCGTAREGTRGLHLIGAFRRASTHGPSWLRIGRAMVWNEATTSDGETPPGQSGTLGAVVVSHPVGTVVV